MSPPEDPGKERFVKFIRIFEEGSKTSAKNLQASEALLGAIIHEKHGLIRAIDDLGEDLAVLVQEIRGLREDFRAVAGESEPGTGLVDILRDTLTARLGKRKRG